MMYALLCLSRERERGGREGERESCRWSVLWQYLASIYSFKPLPVAWLLSDLRRWICWCWLLHLLFTGSVFGPWFVVQSWHVVSFLAVQSFWERKRVGCFNFTCFLMLCDFSSPFLCGRHSSVCLWHFPGHTHLRLTLHVVLLVFLCHSFDKVIDCNFSGHKHIFNNFMASL